MLFGSRIARRDLRVGEDDALAACQVFIREESRAATAHFQHHFVAYKTIVTKEEEQVVAAARIRIDADVIAQGFAFFWKII